MTMVQLTPPSAFQSRKRGYRMAAMPAASGT